MGGVWAKNVSGQRVQGVGRALHVVGRLLQGVRRRRGAVEDVARQAEAHILVEQFHCKRALNLKFK